MLLRFSSIQGAGTHLLVRESYEKVTMMVLVMVVMEMMMVLVLVVMVMVTVVVLLSRQPTHTCW